MIHRLSSLLLILSSLVSLHAQPVATPANIVCYQEVVASQGSYAQINASLSAWSQKMYQTLGLTGPIELQVGWARVPDRTGFENGCNGPYPNIADLFVHIQTTSSQYDSVSSQLENFIAANRMTSQPNIVCSARSIVTYLPGCGKVGSGGNPPNNGNATTAPTQAPGNSTTAPPTNSTIAPTTAPPTNSTGNSTEAPTRGPSPTSAPSNETTEAPTTAAPTEAPSNSTDSSTGDLSSAGSIGNSTSDGNSTSSSTGDSNPQVAGAGAADQSADGSITINGASSISAGSWIVVPCIAGLVTMIQQ